MPDLLTITYCDSIRHMLRTAVEKKRHKHYSKVEKRGVLTVWLVTGSAKETERQTGVNQSTIHQWMRKPWWEEMQPDILNQLGSKLISKVRGVAIESYDQLFDRLKNGDIYQYKGEDYRAPIQAKDLSMIANIAIDKVRLAEGKATSRIERTDLGASALEFKQIADDYMHRIGHQMSGAAPIIEGESIRVLPSASLPGDKS